MRRRDSGQPFSGCGTPETSAVPFCEGIDVIFFESVEAIRFCTPEFPEIVLKYASSAYNTFSHSSTRLRRTPQSKRVKER